MTEGRKIKYTECYTAFIDILGFKHLVDRSQKDPGVLEALVKALNRAANTTGAYHSKPRKDEDGKKIGEDRYLVQIRAFSDCIVIFIPVASNGLSTVLSSVRYLHDRLIELDCVIRGAITIGDMYYEDSWSKTIPDQFKEARTAIKKSFNIEPEDQGHELETSDVLFDINNIGLPVTLGPALVEAYDLETHKAVNPRVIITEKLVSHIINNKEINKKTFSLVSPTPEMQSKRILDFICTDTDDYAYFDFLHEDVFRQDTNRIVRETLADGQIQTRWERCDNDHKSFLAEVKATIEKKLEEGVCMSKYEWLRAYFNSRCDDEMKIN